MSAAILRISASLDLNTVLQEIVEAGRALTGARCGVVTTLDDRGQVEDFVSSGITPEEHGRLAAWADGPRLFESLQDLPAPRRLRDLAAYARSLGVSDDLLPASVNVQGTPLRHRGAHVGEFFIGAKGDGEDFTREDEEVLTLFGAQAATAIANARTHQGEQRARADLEALVETSPVGVAVLDAKTGAPVSVNREARRIVEGLRVPGQSPQELLAVMTCQRGDGRELSLADFPLAQQLTRGEMVRAEEVVLSVPDGRRATTLVNATPIRSAGGEVESVVITMQDLAPLAELERQRAEFLSMVSHELRAPLTSIKGSTATVLGASPGLDPAEVQQFVRIIDEQADHMRGLIADLLDAGHIETGTLSVARDAVEVVGLVEQARNLFLGGGGRHDVRVDLPEDLPRVTADRQRIVQVLNNLFSNAARHAPASSPIRVGAAVDGIDVAISVSDEGRGVAPDRLPHLFHKHATLGGEVRKRGGAGSGLGLSICKGLVEAHGGRIWAESAGPGRGTRFTFTLPATEDARGNAGTGVDPSGPRSPGRARDGTRILVVDDHPQSLRHVRDVLLAAGYVPLLTGDPGELPDLLRTHRPHLVLLDRMLPGADGIELLQNVPELANLPVIFLSGYGWDATVARALELGAADYIVKPFTPTELTARVGAALRRRAEPEAFRLGELTIHYGQRRVQVAGRAVELTAMEFELLRLLSVNAGRVLTHEALLRQVWGGKDAADATLVRSFVKKVRHKLGDDAARPAYILTARGVGYRMPAQEDP